MNVPKTARALVKTTIFPKEVFPYGNSKFETYYKPSCIETILTCKDICGKKYKKECKTEHTACDRGKLPLNFMFCRMREDDSFDELPYAVYELVTESNVKEGKSVYKKMDKTLKDMSVKEFVSQFITEFPKYSQHEVEAWYLNAVRNAAFSMGYMPDHAVSQVIDFAQNLVLEKRHAISEKFK